MEGQLADGVPSTNATALSDSSEAAAPETRSDQTVPTADAFAGRVLSHYRLEERLGAGGMGMLYRATDLKLGRAVAIKLLARHLVTDETAKVRFVREARAASALDHPNIANIYEIGEADSELFIVMALYDGETLKQRLVNGRPSIDEALGILRQVLLGLEAAHGAGIVHRDIKPANILVTTKGAVKILDFGLAKLVSDLQAETMTQTGQAIGTILYMSPEQLRGESVDSRSDLWSFGVLAYEILSGVSPFQSESSASTAMRILNDEPSSLAAVPGVPDWLARLVSQLLRKNPDERPQTASEVRQQLEQRNPAVSTEQRFGRMTSNWRMRSMGPVTAIAVAAGLLVAAIVGWSARSRLSKQAAVDAPRSIAVLPFTSLNSGEEIAYFAQGFHDELLRQLGRIDALRVISRTSVMQYKDGARNLREIAEALGVSSIVEGSVQRAGNRVRVEARLIDARNDVQIWSDRYDRDLSDLFGIQTTVAEEIASSLHARLSSAQKAEIERKPTQSLEAYDLYLRAREYENRPGRSIENLRFAERFYRQALAIDPAFALARAQLAQVLVAIYYKGGRETPDAVLEEARQEALHALQFQPDLAEVHAALGDYHAARRDDELAVQEYEIARPANPALAAERIAQVREYQGRFDDASLLRYEFLRFEPRSPTTLWALGYSLLFARRYVEADQVLVQAEAIAPDFVAAPILRAVVHEAWKGETDLAKAVLRDARHRIDPRTSLGAQNWIFQLLAHNPAEALSFLDSFGLDWNFDANAALPKVLLYANVHDGLGDTALARREYEAARPIVEAELAKRLADTSRGYVWDVGGARQNLARIYAALGQREDAIREAAKAVELGSSGKLAAYTSWAEIARAAVEGRVGETDAAIEHIRQLLAKPSFLSPALLRIDPQWAPLRNDPRFRKLAELDQN